MTVCIKYVRMVITLFLCVSCLNVFITDAHAETTVDDLRKKGQQCMDWQNSQMQGERLNLKGCLNSCARLAAMADQRPSLLTEDRINRCNEEYSAAERQASGKPPIPKDVVKAPETIEAIIKDMNVKERECKAKMESAKTSLEKKYAGTCYNTCYRKALKISRGGVPLEQAKADWKMCVGVKK